MSLFRLHEAINRQLFRSFNISSDLIFKSRPKLRKLLKENNDFRDRHEGERCFILGTGPSLNALGSEDIDFLTGEVCFGVNSLYKSDAVKGVSPSYYLLMDNNFWGISKGTFNEVADHYEDRRPVIITDYRAASLTEKFSEKIFIYAKHYPVDRMRLNMAQNISITMNVVSFGIVSAMFMGFKQIYLLGCDYNLFCSPLNNHCYDDSSEGETYGENSLAFYLKYYALTTEIHYQINRAAKATGSCVVNLTPGSLLDAYPSGDLKKIMKGASENSK